MDKKMQEPIDSTEVIYFIKPVMFEFENLCVRKGHIASAPYIYTPLCSNKKIIAYSITEISIVSQTYKNIPIDKIFKRREDAYSALEQMRRELRSTNWEEIL